MFVTSGAAEIAYTAQGSGRSVLLLHAGVTDKRSWTSVVDALGEGYRTVAFDRRGFGETTYSPETYSPIADALAVLDAERLDRVAVVGSSMGGSLALDLVVEHPERVSALVLIGAGASGAPFDPSGIPPAVLDLFGAYEAAEEAGEHDEENRLAAHIWLDGPAMPEGRVEGSVRDLFLDMNGTSLAHPDPGQAVEVPPVWDRLGQVEVPTLVLVGAHDLTEIAAGEGIAARIPGSRHEVLSDTAHLPHLEGHLRCLEVITEFLAEVR